MADQFNKGMARNIYYGGGVFFYVLTLLIVLALLFPAFVARLTAL